MCCKFSCKFKILCPLCHEIKKFWNHWAKVTFIFHLLSTTRSLTNQQSCQDVTDLNNEDLFCFETKCVNWSQLSSWLFFCGQELKIKFNRKRNISTKQLALILLKIDLNSFSKAFHFFFIRIFSPFIKKHFKALLKKVLLKGRERRKRIKELIDFKRLLNKFFSSFSPSYNK